jgi:hypothetical protein
MANCSCPVEVVEVVTDNITPSWLILLISLLTLCLLALSFMIALIYQRKTQFQSPITTNFIRQGRGHRPTATPSHLQPLAHWPPLPLEECKHDHVRKIEINTRQVLNITPSGTSTPIN